MATAASKSEKLYPNCDATIWLRSCTREIIDPIEGTTTGTIPHWLNGTLLRNGPGAIQVGCERFGHLFDSSALLHRFEIKAGKVTYQCRFVQSEVLKRNRAANRIVLTEFGTKGVPDPCKSIFQRVASIFNPTKDDISDNSMITVYPFGDDVYAFGETPLIHKIDKNTLETQKQVDVSDFVSIVHHSSHPHIMTDGTVYNLGLSIYPTGPHHIIIKFPAGGNMFEKAKIVGAIPSRWIFHPSYMHTFGITENYFIIVEQPLALSVPQLVMSKLKNEPLISCFKWYQNEKTQINVICRKTGNLAYQFHTDAFFYLHIINQYEEEDKIIVDVCTYKDPQMLDSMYTEALENMQHNPNYAEMFRSKPLRFVLPLNRPQQEIVPELITHLGCETPRIHYEQYLGRNYRYFYAISTDVDSANPGTIIKVDIVNKTHLTWCEPNCYPSEPIFVPSPHPQDEDDGVVLLALVWGEETTNKVGFLVLNARDMSELGRTTFDAPGPVPKCLHGWYLPESQF